MLLSPEHPWEVERLKEVVEPQCRSLSRSDLAAKRAQKPIFSRAEQAGEVLKVPEPRLLRDARFTSDDLEVGYSTGPRWLSYAYQGTARPA